MLPELKTLMSYKNQAVLDRYKKDFPNNILSGEESFTQLMKFMWLALKAQADGKTFTCAIHEEMLEIDHMWHTFILFTRDYQHFCEKYLGNFFHHSPNTELESKLSDEEYETELTEYLSYIYDHLGEETVRVWFGE